MVQMLATGLLLTTAFPLWRAWRANRTTSLRHTLIWAIIAWLAWLYAFCTNGGAGPERIVARYLSVCMTGCAIVAVLGARRPGVSAWNVVVLGLLAVALLPLAQSLMVNGILQVPVHWTVLMAAILGVGVINYLPTRLGPAAAMIALAISVELIILVTTPDVGERWIRITPVSRCLLALAPWAAYLNVAWQGAAVSAFDRIWFDFRDRFGLIWGQRMREQFNRSAANSGWPLHLYWQGLRSLRAADHLSAPEPSAILATLHALLKRFGMPAESGQ